MSTPDASNPGPAKRRRTDSEAEGREGSESNVPKRSEAWFDDGNVVLQAEDVQFKVHRSVLVKHSPVFSDVFAIPHPNDEPLVDSCPVVHLHDSAVDIKHIILALYGDENYNTMKAIPFEAVAAMIRLGRKYDIKNLWEQGLHRLTLEAPAKLEDWGGCTTSPSQGIIHQHHYSFWFSLVKLALETGIQTVLPLGLYLCSTNLEILVAGAPTLDGPKVQLPPETVLRCVLGRGKILESIPKGLFGFLKDMGKQDACQNRGNCGRRAAHLMSLLWEKGADVTFAKLLGEHDLCGILLSKQKFCAVCEGHAKEFLLRERQKAWDTLPSYFGLPTWENLKNFGD